MTSGHISDDDLECYLLGTIRAEAELATFEEHLLVCPGCIDRAEQIQARISAFREALLEIETGPAEPEVPHSPIE